MILFKLQNKEAKNCLKRHMPTSWILGILVLAYNLISQLKVQFFYFWCFFQFLWPKILGGTAFWCSGLSWNSIWQTGWQCGECICPNPCRYCFIFLHAIQETDWPLKYLKCPIKRILSDYMDGCSKTIVNHNFHFLNL